MTRAVARWVLTNSAWRTRRCGAPIQEADHRSAGAYKARPGITEWAGADGTCQVLAGKPATKCLRCGTQRRRGWRACAHHDGVRTIRGPLFPCLTDGAQSTAAFALFACLCVICGVSFCRLPSAVCRLPSAVCRLPSAVCRLPSAVFSLLCLSACFGDALATGAWLGTHRVRRHQHAAYTGILARPGSDARAPSQPVVNAGPAAGTVGQPLSRRA